MTFESCLICWTVALIIWLVVSSVADATLCLAASIRFLAFWGVTYGIKATEDFFALASLEAVGYRCKRLKTQAGVLSLQ